MNLRTLTLSTLAAGSLALAGGAMAQTQSGTPGNASEPAASVLIVKVRRFMDISC